MAIKVEVKSGDFAVKSKREQTAQNVVGQFGYQLPDLKLFCFFDGPSVYAGHSVWGRGTIV